MEVTTPEKGGRQVTPPEKIVEAEKASLLGNVNIIDSKSASSGKFVQFGPVGAVVDTSKCPTLPDNTGQIVFNIDILFSSKYYFWARTMAPDSHNNSFYLQIDGKCPFVVGDKVIEKSSWKWINNKTNGKDGLIEFDLTQGKHKVRLVGREAGVKIDKILFVTDKKCTPILTGENCERNL